MDLDYFQHVPDTLSVAVHVACRAVTIAAYGVIGSCVLMAIVVLPAPLAMASSDQYPESSESDFAKSLEQR
jgi:hypothetical protein